MTREDKLYSMRMTELKEVAEKLGIKINTKAAKSKAIEKILDAEKAWEDPEPANEPTNEHEKSAESTDENIDETEQIDAPEPEQVDEIKKPKRGALIEWNGKSQNICAWAKELGKSPNTLYGRIYRLGWSVDKAFTK